MIRVEDHLEQGLQLFNTFFADKVKMRALTGSYLVQIQELEDALWDILAQQGLEEVVPGEGAASGVFLDAIGKIVGENRDGKVDAEYLPYIRAKVKANNSDGQVETLYDILRLILDTNFADYVTGIKNWGYDEIELELRFPLGLVDATLEAAVIRFMLLAISATVRLLITSTIDAFAASLQFSSTYATNEFDSATGIGSEYDGGVGGYLSNTLEVI